PYVRPLQRLILIAWNYMSRAPLTVAIEQQSQPNPAAYQVVLNTELPFIVSVSIDLMWAPYDNRLKSVAVPTEDPVVAALGADRREPAVQGLTQFILAFAHGDAYA